ncbi:uncharacterized protein LOC117790622 [Drosophila innubila]|uniref:uncharacterized protein LOC117790622 n=1 Tax=Drosophila innubila TaxID=198719 RepID=UPI00148E2AB3|nr:uncharacterized protein LOC117790622 [Drosophila innubila]
MSLSSITRPSWKDWVERNAQPKQRYIIPSRSKPTRWQKPGPMTRDQWVSFYKWLEARGGTNHQNAQPTTRLEPNPSPNRQERRQVIPGVFFCVNSQMKDKREKRRQLQAKVEKLSQPRIIREKFVAPPIVPFAYRPQLSYRDPPRPEIGRPVPKPPVPCCFQHEDIEAAFWANIRFPVSKKALRAKTTQKMYELAQPKSYPPKPHCPIPKNTNDQPRKRKKMSRKQWRQHLARIDYLSMPNPRVLAELPSCDCRNCLQFKSRCELCGCRYNHPVL